MIRAHQPCVPPVRRTNASASPPTRWGTTIQASAGGPAAGTGTA